MADVGASSAKGEFFMCHGATKNQKYKVEDGTGIYGEHPQEEKTAVDIGHVRVAAHRQA